MTYPYGFHQTLFLLHVTSSIPACYIYHVDHVYAHPIIHLTWLPDRFHIFSTGTSVH